MRPTRLCSRSDGVWGLNLEVSKVSLLLEVISLFLPSQVTAALPCSVPAAASEVDTGHERGEQVVAFADTRRQRELDSR